MYLYIGPSDYSPISAVDMDVVLVFNNLTRRDCFSVTIVEDGLFEGQEVFTAQLTPQVVFLGTPQGISLFPSIATVTIVDNDDVLTVGFEDDSLSRSVLENVGTVVLCVGVFGQGEVTTSFSVNIDIGSGTAGKYDIQNAPHH